MAAFEIVSNHDAIEEILGPHRADLGSRYPGYRGHAYRMLNFIRYLVPDGDDRDAKAAVMSAWHDLPIVQDGNLVYVERAADLSDAYLSATGRPQWAAEVRAMTLNHHKIRSYRGPYAPMVEAARKADWIDVSFGRLHYGVPRELIKEVAAAFPLTGFYPGPAFRMIGAYAVRHPRRPLPMMRW